MSDINPNGKPRQLAGDAYARIRRFKEVLRAQEQVSAERRARAAALAEEWARYAQPRLRNWWLDACRGERRRLKKSLPDGMADALRAIEQDFTNCGTKIGVLYCRKCGELELGSGDCAVQAGSTLCGRPGCPYCDAEDRALRANTLDFAFDDLWLRAKKEVRKLKSYVAKMQKHRSARTRKGRRILEWRKAAIVRITMSEWWAFEVQYRYQPDDPDGKILEQLTRAIKDLSCFVARLWSHKIATDDLKHDLSAFGAWVDHPSADTVVLRGVYFSPELTVDELTDILDCETQQAKISWLRRVEPEQSAAWAAILSSGADGAPDAATFAEGWHSNHPRRAIPARLALIWSAAAAEAQIEAVAWSYRLLRDRYLPIRDQSRRRRVESGPCAGCRAVVPFRERIVDTEQYLRACEWLNRSPLAPRELPSEPEGYVPESEGEASTDSEDNSSSEND